MAASRSTVNCCQALVRAGLRRGWTSCQVTPSALMATPSKSAPPVKGLVAGALAPSLKPLAQKERTTPSRPARSRVRVASLRELT